MLQNKGVNTQVVMIMAICDNGAIGNDGSLLVHDKTDMKMFKDRTTGGVVLMGRKTFESLPNGALPNRTNIVLTRDLSYKADNALVINSLEDIPPVNNIYVIGGSEIYSLFMPVCDEIMVTRFFISKDFDTFVEIDDEWVYSKPLKEWKTKDEIHAVLYSLKRF